MSARVLLVEDDTDARETLHRAIERAGYACTSCGSAHDAREAVLSLPFDAAVVDIVLGNDERGGLELLPLLRSETHRTPVVVITAFADLEKVKLALNDGAAYLLEKPFRARELCAIVARLLADRDDLGHIVARSLTRAGLTEKELAIARLILKGLTSAEIARIENNSDKTIRQHITQVYAKCGVSSRAEFFHFVFPT